MNTFLILAFLFCVGSVGGWILELLFRNMKRKTGHWINPGFCTGPYVPLYGFGLCIMYLIASLEPLRLIEPPFWNKTVLFLLMACCMTVIEYLAGILCLKYLNLRLWDYSSCWGNIKGIICPKFSCIWAAMGAVYYFCVHPHVLDALDWLSRNMAFSFFVGLFFGVFLIDVAHSAQLVNRLRKFAEENDVVVRYEALKFHIYHSQRALTVKYNFFRPFKSERPLTEHLRELYHGNERGERLKKHKNIHR